MQCIHDSIMTVMFVALILFRELIDSVLRTEVTITYSTLNSPCFAWHPYGKSGLFKVV